MVKSGTKRSSIVTFASNPNLLDLLQGEHIRSPVVELGGPRGGMRGDGLRLLDCPAVLQVGRNAGSGQAGQVGKYSVSGIIAVIPGSGLFRMGPATSPAAWFFSWRHTE